VTGQGASTGSFRCGGRTNCRITCARSRIACRIMACSPSTQPQRRATESVIAANPGPVIFATGIRCLLLVDCLSNPSAKLYVLYVPTDCPNPHVRGGSQWDRLTPQNARGWHFVPSTRGASRPPVGQATGPPVGSRPTHLITLYMLEKSSVQVRNGRPGCNSVAPRRNSGCASTVARSTISAQSQVKQRTSSSSSAGS
jgi:hypothetical protein